MKIFLICPVRKVSEVTQIRIAAYVRSLEEEGHQVYWPSRDTPQNDPSGGYDICLRNCRAMMEADEIHIWYDESSQGSKFDIGVAFTLVVMQKWEKKIVIANDEEIIDESAKSFYKVLKRIVAEQARQGL